MQYKGKLYGHIDGKYIAMIMTADDVDKMERERDDARLALAKMVKIYEDALIDIPSEVAPRPPWITDNLTELLALPCERRKTK